VEHPTNDMGHHAVVPALFDYSRLGICIATLLKLHINDSKEGLLAWIFNQMDQPYQNNLYDSGNGIAIME
jgi:hypothetical protein